MRQCCDSIPGYQNWKPGVFRVLIEPDPYDSELHPASLQHCLQENVVGIGWRLDSGQGELDCFDNYQKELEGTYSDQELISAKKNSTLLASLKPGDLVWVMAKPRKKGHCPPSCPPLLDYGFTKSILYIGLVIGFWEYRNKPLAQLTDMMSVVPVLFQRAFVLSDSGVEDWGDYVPSPEDKELTLIELLKRELVGGTGNKGHLGTVMPVDDTLVEFSKRVWCQLIYRRRAFIRETIEIS